MNHSNLRAGLRFGALPAAIAVSLMPTLAGAQEAGEKEATNLDRIEVTGSRIKRTDIETSQPVFSLSRDDISAQGLTSVGDVIQNLTANGSTLNSTINNGGNGETRVSLRNLGSNRTLVLVNGRRWVGGTGLGGAVDLNTIPTAAVERIEVLKDGASTIYGSDAIAGVVNVILRQNFDGAEANAYFGQFDKGDGTRQSYDFTIGSTGDRFSAMLGFGYVKEEPVMAGDRYISKEPIYLTGTDFGSSTTPEGRFSLCNGTFDPQKGLCSVAQTRPRTAGPNGTTGGGTATPGSAGDFTYNDDQTGINWRNRTAADLYNFAPDNYLLTPQERRSVFANASVDITDDVRFKTTITYNQRVSEQLLAAMPIVLGTGPGANTQARGVAISAQSVYNPFGTTVSKIQRRAVETGGRSFNQDVRTFAIDAGLEGTLTFGEKYFDWEAGYFRGENKANNTTRGLFNVIALSQALGPSFRDAQGIARCGTSTAVIPGCVPLNLLGAPGSITQDMLDYVTFTAHDEYNYTQKTYYANVSGDLFDMPAGALGFSFGLEHRTEDGYDSPDALINSGNTTGNARTATAGGYGLDEAYLELAIPVLADMPGAKLLDFSLATRYSDYSNFGDTLNSKFGFRWKPIDDLLVRGNWSEGFRAPSIGEMFAGQADSFPTIADPCSNTFGGGLDFTGADATSSPLTAEQVQRCVAQGAPATGYDQGNAQIRITTGGNLDLQPEKAESYTFGLVYSPSFVEGLDIALDWWQIKLDDAITVPGGQGILNNCIRNNIQLYCNLYSRNPGGTVANLLATTTNIGGTRVEGYDLTIGYRLPETSWGKFSFTWDSTYQAEVVNDIDGDGIFGELDDDGGDNLVGEYQDRNNNWRIRSNLASRWEKGDWGATWNIRYYSRQSEPCLLASDTPDIFCDTPDRMVNDQQGNPVPAPERSIGATTYHDVSAYWNAPWNAKITLGVNNVFDKNPPIAFTTFANSFDPQYEVPGQFLYMSYNQKF